MGKTAGKMLLVILGKGASEMVVVKLGKTVIKNEGRCFSSTFISTLTKPFLGSIYIIMNI